MGKGKNGSDGLQVTHCRGSSGSKPKICCRRHCCPSSSSWKWQGQQLARDGRLIQTKREMTWTTTCNLICNQRKNVVCVWNSQCCHLSVCCSLGSWFQADVFFPQKNHWTSAENKSYETIVINEHGHGSALIQQLLVSFYLIIAAFPHPALAPGRIQWNAVYIFKQDSFHPSSRYYQLTLADSNIVW